MYTNNYTKKNTGVSLVFLYKIGFVVLFTVALILSIIFLLPERTAAAENDRNASYRIFSVEIESGDTLWTIAEEYYSEEFDSIQEYIREIKRMNNLSSDVLFEGAYLLIPCYQ